MKITSIKKLLTVPALDVSIDQLKSSLLLFFRQGYVGKKFTLSKLGTIKGKTYTITIIVEEYK